jgi:hypothetical protein
LLRFDPSSADGEQALAGFGVFKLAVGLVRATVARDFDHGITEIDPTFIDTIRTVDPL